MAEGQQKAAEEKLRHINNNINKRNMTEEDTTQILSKKKQKKLMRNPRKNFDAKTEKQAYEKCACGCPRVS